MLKLRVNLKVRFVQHFGNSVILVLFIAYIVIINSLILIFILF